MSTLADAKAREAIRTALDRTLVVEAAAGTGKTTELVARIVGLVRTGRARLATIAAVTFTEKAAGEMKLRLRTELEKARLAGTASEEERRRFAKAVEELETAHIGTIHGLCAELLRERPVQARVDPHFEVAAGDEADRLASEAFDAWFDSIVLKPPEGVRRLLRRRPKFRDAPGPRDVLRMAARDVLEHRDFATPWRRPDAFDRDGAMETLVGALEELGAYAEKAGNKDDWLPKNLADVARWIYELRRKERNGDRDHDGLEAALRDLARLRSWKWKGSGKWYAKGIERATVLEQREAVRERLEAFVATSDADLAALLHAELQPFVEGYERLKTMAGRLDFLDLLLKLRDLVRDDKDARVELQGRFTHLLVDEFQDTDPLQAEILMLLGADDPDETDWLRARPIAGRIFVVGDPKQSIYRFRRADVALYEAVKRRLLAAGAEVLHLTTSFRSVPGIQSAVNAAFSLRMKGGDDSAQAEYVPLDHFRDEIATQPSVVALPVPAPFSEWGRVTNQSIDDSLPDAVGAFVAQLLKLGWKVRENGGLVPIEARHVCLLFKRFVSFREDVTRDYVRALEARRVPHVLVGGRSYHEREEVLALRTALVAVEWPDDELSVFAALKGPFFALSDEQLLAFRDAAHSLHPMRPLDDVPLTDLTKPVAEALAILRKLHFERNRRPIADTVSMLLEQTRAHAGLAIAQSGEQVLANVLRLVESARRFESTGATSFRAFTDQLRDEAERGDAGEAPIVEEGADGVRMMTVHRAKGLEFPIVILCDPTAPLAPSNPSRWVDPERRLWVMPLAGCVPTELEEKRDEVLRRDTEEAVRLAYVATTRAKDLLVVPVVGEERIDGGWVSPLEPALYPIGELRRQPQPAPGCPPFGTDTIVSRPEKRANEITVSVMPGLHAPEAGDHRVVWWDPHTLELGVAHEGGIRHQKLLEIDEGGVHSDEGERNWRAWSERRTRVIGEATRPLHRVEKATNTAIARAEQGGGGALVLSEKTAVARQGRPHGKRFGTLVHAVLAEAPLEATPELVAKLAVLQGRIVGASDDEVKAAEAAAIAALSHPLMRRAATSEDCRREVPLLVRTADGALVESVVDLAFKEKQGDRVQWIVVDFKTDGELSERRAAYEEQVRLYAAGIREATGEPAVAVLLGV